MTVNETDFIRGVNDCRRVRVTTYATDDDLPDGLPALLAWVLDRIMEVPAEHRPTAVVDRAPDGNYVEVAYWRPLTDGAQ